MSDFLLPTEGPLLKSEVTIDLSTVEAKGALRLLCQDLVSDWSDEPTEQIHLKPLSGGCTNILYRARLSKSRAPSPVNEVLGRGPPPVLSSTPQPQSLLLSPSMISPMTGPGRRTTMSTWDPQSHGVLVRVFGTGSQALIDRTTELTYTRRLAALGLAAPIHGVFTNGLIYGFTPGSTLSLADLHDEKTIGIVAAATASFHVTATSSLKSIPVPSGRAGKTSETSPGLLVNLASWTERAKPAFGIDEPRDGVLALSIENQGRVALGLGLESNASGELIFSTLLGYVERLTASVKASKSGVGFCHNDLNPINMIRDKVDHDVLHFIDFEYCSWNYIDFEIANHFCEFAGYDGEWELLPTREEKLMWLSAYIKTSMQLGGSIGRWMEERLDNGGVDAWVDELDLFMAASSLLWGLWGVCQGATESTEVDFDFLGYGAMRLKHLCKTFPAE